MEQDNSYRGEIQATLRKVDFSSSIENAINEIISLKGDVYNDKKSFHEYERQVKKLNILINGYYDMQYSLVSDDINNTPIRNIYDKVNVIDRIWGNDMVLLKRKGFTPPEEARETSYIIIRNIITRIANQYDSQVVIHGNRGVGKSYVALSLARQIAQRNDLEFDVSKHVFFETKKMREYIENEKPTPGQPLIYDEAGGGKGMGKRRAMSGENIDYYEILQTMREMGLCIFYTVPDEKDIDSGQKKMFTAEIEVLKKDVIEKINLVKFKENKDNIMKYPRDSLGNKVTRCIISKPFEIDVRPYKKMKSGYMYERIKIKPDKRELKYYSDINTVEKDIRENMEKFVKTNKDRKFLDKDELHRYYKENQWNAKIKDLNTIKKKIDNELNENG